MISLVIPHWAYLPEHDSLLDACVKSMDADEYLVIVNDGIGMGKAVNIGFRLAHGDFLIMANNDTVLTQGSLKDLCDPEAITVPTIGNQVDQLPRSFYCMPRWVYEKVGGYDEQFERGYFEDDDLIQRWREADIPIRLKPNVIIQHIGGATLGKMADHQAVFDRNRALFEAKWGKP